MHTANEQLHPNWRALATIHLPLKRFLREGTEAQEKGNASKTGDVYRIAGIDGAEASKFYEEILAENRTVTLRSHSQKKIVPCIVQQPQQISKVPFDKSKYFRYAMSNDVEALRNMHVNGINMNCLDVYGWSALMMAACEGAADVVTYLLELGINRYVQDKAGYSALTLAQRKGHTHIVELLLEAQELPRNEGTQDVIHEEPSKPFYCETCQREFTATTERKHQTSTLHQFNVKSTLPANKLEKFNIPPKNRGLKLMVKQGWDKESGLGPAQSGRLYPVKTVIRKQRSGLGIEQPPARVTHYGAFDLRATQRHGSDYYKKKPRNRNDMRREKQREWKRERRLRNELS